MKCVEWGEFNIEELFGKSTRGKRLKSADRIVGDLPFVTAGEANEGISAFIGNDVTIFSDNTTTIDMFGSAKYRGYQYGADDHIAVVHTENLPRGAAIFVTSAIHKSSYTGKFDYGRNFYAKDADALNISLPIRDGLPDYEMMNNFIEELEQESKSNLDIYLESSGFKNYILTPVEQMALDEYDNVEFKKFKVVDLFDVKNSGNILSRDIVENSGDIPYLCASSENNAVSSYISYDDKYIDKGNCIFIGGKTFVVSYQNRDFYSNDSHNLILHIKDEKLRNRLTHLFLVTCIERSLGHKYSWGDSISNRKIQKDEIYLPVKDNQPYFEIMEPFVSAIEKLVIKDVVLYANGSEVG